VSDFLELFIKQLQSPTLGFLLGGIVVASFGSQLAIPDSIYRFITFFLLIKIGLSGGIAIRNSNFSEVLLPALAAMAIGIIIVLISRYTLARLPGIKVADAVATGGLFGAVSGFTLAAVLPQLDSAKIPYEAWTAALYPFMDIPALVTAIVVASVRVPQHSRATIVLCRFVGWQLTHAAGFKNRLRLRQLLKQLESLTHRLRSMLKPPGPLLVKDFQKAAQWSPLYFRPYRIVWQRVTLPPACHHAMRGK